MLTKLLMRTMCVCVRERIKTPVSVVQEGAPLDQVMDELMGAVQVGED